MGARATDLEAAEPQGVRDPFKDAVSSDCWTREAGQSLSGAALDGAPATHPGYLFGVLDMMTSDQGVLARDADRAQAHDVFYRIHRNLFAARNEIEVEAEARLENPSATA